MSLTCTRLEAAGVEPVLEAVDAALGRGLLLARLLLELLRDRVARGDHLVDGGDAREPDGADDRGRQREVDDEHREAAREAQRVSVETSGLSSIAMMPEIRNTNSACLTAPAKIQPKNRMVGSAISWIQRGMSSTSAARRWRRRARSRFRFLLIGQCVLLELPRHHEAHAVPSTGWPRLPKADPCPRVGPAPAGRSARASGGGGSDCSSPCLQRQPSVSPRRSPAVRRLLPSRGRSRIRPRWPAQPAPQTLATRGSLQLMVPIDQHVITGVVFHRYDGLRRGLALARRPPAQRRPADAHVERRVRRRRRRPGLQRRLRLDPGRRRRRAGRDRGLRAGRRPGRLDHALRAQRRRHALRPGDRDQPVLRSLPRRQDRAHRAHRRPARQADAARRRAGHRRPHASSAPSSTSQAPASRCSPTTSRMRGTARASASSRPPLPRCRNEGRVAAMRLLFIADIFGRPGREAVESLVPAPARGARPRPRGRERRERRRRRRHHRPARRPHPRERRRLHHARQPHLAPARLRQLPRPRAAHRAAGQLPRHESRAAARPSSRRATAPASPSST